jgi:hypothetical protein
MAAPTVFRATTAQALDTAVLENRLQPTSYLSSAEANKDEGLLFE